MAEVKIIDIETKDIRFPTTLTGDGSDPTHEPDYSAAYVILRTNSKESGHGFAFTIGRGTEIVCECIKAYSYMVRNENVKNIFANFGKFWTKMCQEPQLRWLGPEKGVSHMAISAIFTALWDLWAKIEKKPVWQLVTEMSVDEILNLVDFNYLSDALTREEAKEILTKGKTNSTKRVNYLKQNGYPAYVTIGWSGYSDEKLRDLCVKAKSNGWTRFKMKVGKSVEEDKKRAKIIREVIGEDSLLMMDCNQKWDFSAAILWMKQLTHYRPLWIEEPTHPDDVIGHKRIREGLADVGIGVATGEHCANRILFKQLIQNGALDFAQIDACRLGSINEMLAVALIAAKYNVPICPHAGGIGLCELVQHISVIDYICISTSLDLRMTEWADFLHEHMVNPASIKNGNYILPEAPGYNSEIKESTIKDYSYPNGRIWQQLFAEGKFKTK